MERDQLELDAFREVLYDVTITNRTNAGNMTAPFAPDITLGRVFLS
jgi:hypothetical protein